MEQEEKEPTSFNHELGFWWNKPKTKKMEEEKQRTQQQNKALHVLFELLAEKLNDSGLDMRKTLKESIDIPWTRESVKEFLWRPVQKAQLQKTSTTELTTKDIDKVFETLNRYLGEKFGLNVPFPSIEEVINKQIDIK